MKIDLWKALERANLVDEFYNAITEYITEETGFCVNSYGLDDKITINVNYLSLDKGE